MFEEKKGKKMKEGRELRKNVLKTRDNLKKSDQKEKSNIIVKSFLQLEEVRKAENLFVYVSFRSEVETLSLIEFLLREEKTVTVPLTHVNEKRLDAVKLYDISQDLVPGYCGILEPDINNYKKKVIDPATLEVIVLPGSVFDERGGRFGYGGGYYDRFLQKAPHALRIGLAFELQMVREAPIQQHDEILDIIVTEKRIINGSRK